MATAADFLHSLRDDPSNARALDGLVALGEDGLKSDDAGRLLASTRRSLRDRGAVESACKLLNLEIAIAVDSEQAAKLWVELGTLQAEGLEADSDATSSFERALELQPNDSEAREALDAIQVLSENAQTFAEKFRMEAETATDRDLACRLYTSAALMLARTDSSSEEVESLLRRATELVPHNARAHAQLQRRYRRDGRWEDLASHLRARIPHAATSDENALLNADLADALEQLGREDEALGFWREVLNAQPGHGRAMATVVESLEKQGDNAGLLEVYEQSLAVRKAGDKEAEVGILMQLGMLSWRGLGDKDRADEYFRRVRKLEPANLAVLDFYREFYPERGESHKLLQLLRQAVRQLDSGDEERRRALSEEMAGVAEHGVGNLEKAIDAWKQILRSDAQSEEARVALKRLFRKTEKWNALLDLMKEEIESVPDDDTPSRIAALEAIVEIYRDRLNLPTMVISTYNNILALDPRNRGALSALAEKYEQLGRWNDLIGVLQREVDSADVTDEDKVAVLRRMASLWVDHFGNYAQAIGPLAQLLELRPGDAAAIEQLKDIYERRRQWRPLLELFEREAPHLEPDARRLHYKSMARLAMERLGDGRLAIELWNHVAELPCPDGTDGFLDPDVTQTLTTLYEREKRYLALAEMYRRRRMLAGDDRRAAVQVLDRLGNLFAERLDSPVEAANVYREILELEPHNGRALRTLRELYAQAGDFEQLESMFAELGQWAELVDSLSTIADRVVEPEKKASLLLRAAQIAAERFGSKDRIARAYERLLSVDPQNQDAAAALVPIYRDLGKWARLLSVYEVVLSHQRDRDARIALMFEIRDLCEQRLQSKAMAFQWTTRVYALAPRQEGLVEELERLASQADAWEELVVVLDARLGDSDIEREESLRLLRLLGRIAVSRLHKPDLARDYQRRVLQLDPGDVDASRALEDIAKEQADWPNLLKIYRRRAESESDLTDKLDQLFRVAHIQDTQIADRQAAAKTYEEILEIDPSSRRAVRALGKLRESEGDIEGLVAVLRREIELVGEVDSKVELYLRIGSLCEETLAETSQAVAAYREALALAPERTSIHAALEGYLEPERDVDREVRVEVANLLLPTLEGDGDAARLARVIEVLRQDASGAEALRFDKRLVGLYTLLGDIERAYSASSRVLRGDPLDADNRADLLRCGSELGRWEDTATRLHTAVEILVREEADQAVLLDIASVIADIYEMRVGDAELAEAAWRRVLEIDATASSAYEALQRIFRATERYEALRDLYADRERHTSDADRRKELVLSIAEINQDILDDRRGAIEAYVQAIEIDPSLLLAYKALEHLYSEAQEWAALDDLLTRELDYVENDREHIDLTARLAALKYEQLDDVPGALALAEDVVARARDHAQMRQLLERLLGNSDCRVRVARTLEPIYKDEGSWNDLTMVLRAQLEGASTSEQVDLLARIASVEEESLGNESGAFQSWRRALELAPDDERPRRALLRIAATTGAWDGAAEALESALEPADASTRANILLSLVEIYDRHLGDVEGAIRACKALVDLDPRNPETALPALQTLDRLYEAYDRWPELAPVVRMIADWSENSDERRERLTRLAGIHEHNLGDDAAAISTWQEILADEPDDAKALDALERLYITGERYRDLADLVRRRVETAADDVEKRAQLRRLGNLHDVELDDVAEAIAALLEVLDFSPDDAETLSDLAGLYRRTDRFPDLFEVLERRLALLEDPEQRVAIAVELGSLLQHKLGRSHEALERFASVLKQDPENAEARRAVEQLAEDPSLLSEACSILEPIYEAGGRNQELARLYGAVADATDDNRERMRRLLALANVLDGRLQDPGGAFAAYRRVAADAVKEPELHVVVEQLERLATSLDRRRDLIETYRGIATDVLDGELQRRLYLSIAELVWQEHTDVGLAREYYQLVLDSNPEDSRAAGALEDIYRETEDWEELVQVLSRRADVAGDDLVTRVDALSEMASISDEKLSRFDDAVMAWEQVLDLVPDNHAALDALESLYRRAERFHDLADLLERRLGYAFDTRAAVALRFELGGIYEKHLSDPERAVGSFGAALEGDHTHRGAKAALERYLDEPGTRGEAARTLEPVYVATQNWPQLVRIYEIKLEAAEDHDERLALTRYIARLYEDQLEDLEGAFRWYGRLFRESPEDRSIRDQLMRLASVLESWEQLANVYQEFLDDETEDTPEVLDVALILAGIYDRRLGEIERAHVAYRRVLSAEPDDVKTFASLESMLLRAERWYAAVELYEDTIEASMDSRRRIELHLRTARLFEEQLNEQSRAVESFRSVLEIDPDDATAIGELDRLYQELERWEDLAELLSSRVDVCEALGDLKEANGYRLRLAGVFETHLKDVGAAIDHYAVALTQPGAQAALSALERLVLNEEHRQRIASLLEPLYRKNDWWQKLVIILDAQLEYYDEPEKRRSMLREIAHIHESRGGDQMLALRALARAWQGDIRDEEVYAELSALATKLGTWDQMVEFLESGIRDSYDYDQVAIILTRLADVHELHRGDVAGAIAAWTRLLEIRDDDARALAELDRLYEGQERWAEQAKIIQRRAELTDDDGVRVVLLHRVAVVLDEKLGDYQASVGEYNNVLAIVEDDRHALDALERLYEVTEMWPELGQTMSRKLELEERPEERRRLRLAASRVYDAKLSDVYEAIGLLTAQLDEAPGDGEFLAELDRLYEREAMWSELVEVLSLRAGLASDVNERAEILYRIGVVVEEKLVDLDAAVDRYAAVLDLVPSHRGARRRLDTRAKTPDTLWAAAAVLERLYHADKNYDGLADLFERRLLAGDAEPDARLELYRDLAGIHESYRQDRTTAFEVWARSLVDFPEAVEVREQLERLAADMGTWSELAAVYEARLDDTVDGDLEFIFANELGRIYDQDLGDLSRSAQKYRQALRVAEDEGAALAQLAKIYTRSASWAELAEIVARQAQVAEEEAEQAQFLYQLADIHEQKLHQLADAVDDLREVLDRDGTHEGARSALWRLMGSDSLRRDVIGILEPIFEDENNAAQLADVLMHKLADVDDRFERAALYARVADLAENHLGDPVRALDATGGWLAEDPQSEDALSSLQRLGAQTQRWDEVAARLKGILDSGEAETVRSLFFEKLGETYLDRLGDVARAEKVYRDLLSIEPDSQPALYSLLRIFREQNDLRRLADVSRRLAEVLDDPEQKKMHLTEVGQLKEQLGDLDGATEAWRDVLALDEADALAHERLSDIFYSESKWDELIEVLRISANYSASPEAEKITRANIASVYADRLGELDEAAKAWLQVIDVDPADLGARASLEAVYTQSQDWDGLVEALLSRLEVVGSDDARIATLIRLVDVSLAQRNAPEDAIAYLQQILELEPGHTQAVNGLEGLFTKSERWHELVELYEAEVERCAGDSAGRDLEVMAKLADLWDGPLENPDAASEVLEQMLERQPGFVPALTRLAKIYENNGDWGRCADVLTQALELGPEGREAADLHFRLGEVARAQNADDASIKDHYLQALRFDATHLDAMHALEQIARANEDWPMLADMLAHELPLTDDKDKTVQITVELHELYAKLGQLDAAIPYLEKAAQLAPEDARILAPLADVYFDSGRIAEAAPMYEQLADVAKKGRRMKDLARFKQRIGGIFEAAGDGEKALAAYEEAFRVDPTNIATMAGLGRLYIDAQNWDKARRVYRSMVLQTLDDSVGISKAEVYYNLGYIHVQLNEPRKAKSMFQRGLELEPQNPKLKAGIEMLSQEG